MFFLGNDNHLSRDLRRFSRQIFMKFRSVIVSLTMEIVDRKDGIDVRKIDATCRDKWKWDWLEKPDDMGHFLSDYIRKLNTAGKAICTICNTVITYGTSGRKQLLKHGISETHKQKRKTRDTNQSLPSWFSARASAESGESGRNNSAKANDNQCEMPYGAPPNCHNATLCTSGKVQPPLPNVSFADRKANAEALVTSFVAENNIKFNQTQKVIKLAKQLAEDPKVLQDLSMERTTCSYKLTDGLGLVTHKRIVRDVRVPAIAGIPAFPFFCKKKSGSPFF